MTRPADRTSHGRLDAVMSAASADFLISSPLMRHRYERQQPGYRERAMRYCAASAAERVA